MGYCRVHGRKKENVHNFSWKTGNSFEKPSCGWDCNIKILGNWLIKVNWIGLRTGFSEGAFLFPCPRILKNRLQINYIS
jgi:hypothetical protein